MKSRCRPRWAGTGLSVTVAAVLLAVVRPAAGQAVARQGAGDWFQWRGPQRNGISAEKGWLAKWPAKGPKQAWKFTIGSGHCTVAVSSGRVYAMGNAKKADTVWCLDAATGERIWSRSYPCRIGEHPGPRATPTVDGKVVYTISRQGDLHCFNAATGKTVWSKNVAKEVRAKVPGWGFAGSPLVDGKLLIVNVGTAGVALDKATGQVVWKTGRGKAGFASPVLFNMGGRRCVLIFGAEALFCVDIKTGRQLWSLPWETEYDVNAADPIVVGNRIFISSGYGKGCALLKVEGGKRSIVWRNKRMKNHFSTCVLYQGHLYGADGNAGGAVVRCIEFETGKLKWSSPRLGMASLMLADGKLIIMGDGGRLIVAQASPAGFKLISQAQVLRGQCWTMPVLAGGRIYCRNSGKKTGKGELVCLEVKPN